MRYAILMHISLIGLALGGGGKEAQAATYYVNPGESIQDVIDDPNVVTGDEIRVAEGVYFENIILKDGLSLHGGHDPISWQRAISNYPTIIDGNSDGSVITAANYTLIDGFVITGGSGTPLWSAGNTQPYMGGGIFCHNNDYVTISNNVIKDNRFSGGGGAGIGIFGGSYIIIENNLIAGNAVYAHRPNEGMGGGIGVMYQTNRITIKNNTLVSNMAELGGGVGVLDNPIDPIVNCIVWDSRTYWGDGEDLFGVNAIYSNIMDGAPGIGNISLDPCFVELGYWVHRDDPNIIVEPNDRNALWVEGNYHLLAGSPSIDTGDPNYIPEPNETDLDGNPRVVNGRIDMGAYEFIPPVEVELKLTPQMLNCNSHGNWLKAHVIMPEEICPEDIDVNTPAVADPPGVESEFIEVNEYSDGYFDVQIYFDREIFCEELSKSEDGFLEVTVTGSFIDGRKFQGSDTIKLKSKPRQHRIRKLKR